MRKLITKVVAAGAFLTIAGTAAAETSITADFASAYVFRGYTLNDETVFQPGIEASGLGLPEEIGTFTVGAWGNFDIGDYGGEVNSGQFSEVDWYASYALPIEVVAISIGITDYTYPALADTQEDVEINLGIGYDIAGFALTATAYRGVSGSLLGGLTTLEFGVEYGFELNEALSASVSADVRYMDGDDTSGWNDGTIGAGISYALSDAWAINASVTYIAQLDDDVLVDGPFAYDVDFLGTIGIGTTF